MELNFLRRFSKVMFYLLGCRRKVLSRVVIRGVLDYIGKCEGGVRLGVGGDIR